ncbi:MAG: FIST N-terminal domain-containing protein [Cellulophaga sp.]
MKLVQAKKEKGSNWVFLDTKETLIAPLVLVFGNRYMLEDSGIYKEIRTMFPGGNIVFGSTSGEILANNVIENSITITAIEFSKSHYKVCSQNISNYNNNIEELGEAITNKLLGKDLKHIFIMSEGSTINGSTLIKGLEHNIPVGVSITGGLSGDDARFERTLVSYNTNPKEGEVVAIGFYGASLEITYANFGGWTGFGPERIITKSTGNILYELDNKPALDLYKTYLGDKADELPHAALFYPLKLTLKGTNESLVRTILNVNDKENTMTLAGDVPEGALVQLMMSTVDDIAEGASIAASYAMRGRKKEPELSILISCIGRKLVMDQRVEEEVEEVIEIIGEKTKVTGFYSYGEMSPFAGEDNCVLQNQTMTLTLISE